MAQARQTTSWFHRDAENAASECGTMTDRPQILPSSVKWLTWIGIGTFGGGLAGYLLAGSALPSTWESVPLLVAGTGAVMLGMTHRRVRPYLRS